MAIYSVIAVFHFQLPAGAIAIEPIVEDVAVSCTIDALCTADVGPRVIEAVAELRKTVHKKHRNRQINIASISHALIPT